MELMEERPDLAYLLLISAVETIACDVLRDYQPTREEILASRGQFAEDLSVLGDDRETVDTIVLRAARDDPWNKRKFCRFLLDNIDDEIWAEDVLFDVPEMFRPKRENLANTLRLIYDHRSRAVHAGRPFGAVAGVGTTPGVPVRAMQELFAGGSKMPPVTWFERVVNRALLGFMERATRWRESLA